MSDFQTPSRRQFLAATATTAAAATMNARSYAQVEGANNRLRVGIIGCGGIARHHLDKMLPMRAEENIDVVAVCDVYDRHASRFAQRIRSLDGNADQYADYRAVLDRDDIDYVLIATPEHSHAYLTLDALDAGKHVYVEKPMTHTIKQAQDVLAKVAETGLKVQVGVQGMADDSYSSAREAIRAGKIGSVVQAQIDYVRDYQGDGPWRTGRTSDEPKPDGLDWVAWQQPARQVPWDARRFYDWRCYSAYSGGIATDLFIHRLTRLLKACDLGYPNHVVGMGGIYTWPDGRDLPDSFEMMAEYGPVEGITEGMTLHVLGTMANDRSNDHLIRGTRGTLRFNSRGWEIANEDGEVTETHRKTGAEDVDPHHRNHHAAIRDGAPLYCPPELGAYGVVAVVMANVSCARKRMLAWDHEQGRVRADWWGADVPEA